MTAPRIHYADRETGSGLVVALCGHLPAAHRATRERDAVTCRLCRARLAAVPFAPGELTEEEPWQPPPPKPMETKDSRWGDMPERVRRLATRGTQRAESRPRWSSVEDAVKHLLSMRIDGYPSPSATASVEAIGTTGTRVQSGRRGSSKAARLAELAAEVDGALTAALDRATWPDGVTPRVARAAWLAHRFGVPGGVEVWEGRAKREATVAEGKLVPLTAVEVGRALGLESGDVTVIAHQARRVVHVELAARGLMATPGSMRARVEVRRRELLRKGA